MYGYVRETGVCRSEFRVYVTNPQLELAQNGMTCERMDESGSVLSRNNKKKNS